MTTDSAVASLQADLTALRAENKELTERLNQLEAAAEASGAAQGPGSSARRWPRQPGLRARKKSHGLSSLHAIAYTRRQPLIVIDIGSRCPTATQGRNYDSQHSLNFTARQTLAFERESDA